MTIRDLEATLAELRVRADAVCLTGGLPNEAYKLESKGCRWRVYYSERGQRTKAREFDGEAEACADLLRRVLDDQSTRQT